MSYILDALKKAEREREIAEVPTLGTVHEARTPAPRRLRPILIVFILCIAAAAVFLLFNQGGSERTAVVRDGEPGGSGNQTELEQMPDTHAVFDPTETGIAEKPPVIPAPEADSETWVRMKETGKPPASEDSPEAEIEKQNARAAISSDPNAFYNRTEAESGVLFSEEYEQEPWPPDPEVLMRNDRDRWRKQISSDDLRSPTPQSFKEAVSEMTMSVLFFSENSEKSMVFIDGRKYVEGDVVAGKYLIEAITPEGAVLSYGGERITLRPEPRSLSD